MSTDRIANRYAKPLLELAEEQEVFDQVREDMDEFVSLCQENRDFLLMLKNPIISHLKKAEILKKIFEGKANKLTMSIFDVVTRKNRENLLPEIARAFVRLCHTKMGYQEATLTTAFAIDDELRRSFQKIIKEVTGDKAVMNEQVDQSILGGYVLTMGDQQLDESVHSYLREIKLKFTKE